MEKRVIFILIVLILVTSILSIINADVISINAGGDEELVITSDKYIEGFFTGAPTVTPTIDLDLLYPTGNVNVTKNLFFNVTVNVTCRNADCGEINVSLDPDHINTETVESTNNVGQYSSIAIDSNNKVHISHRDATNNDSRYCNNTAGTWSCTAVETTDNVGYYSSIAIDSNNKVHISHQDYINKDLRYCNNTAGTWSCTAVETTDSVGQYSSIAIDSNNKVHISHREAINKDLRYCNNTAGTWSCIAIDTAANDVGWFSSIAIDSNNKVHISHRDATNGNLRYCNNTAGTWSCTTVEAVGQYSSIAIDSNNKVHISHREATNGDLRYCNNTAGTWSCTAVEITDNVGHYSSIAIDSNNKVHISHYDSTNGDLRYCNNTAGTWSCIKVTDTDGYYLGWPNGRALAIKKGRIVDSTSFSSKAHISWYNDTNLMYTSVDIGVKSGLVSTTSGETPFYTNESNPRNISLNKDQSQLVVFWVNATGALNSSHTFFVYANKTSDMSISNITSKWNVTIVLGEVAISISLSPKLSQQINWTLVSLPVYNQSAEGNNDDGNGVTDYYVNVSVEGGTADLYIKASGDLITQGLDILGLGNETLSYNVTDSSVPSLQKYSLTTNYSDNKIGDNLGGNSVVYLKFFLNAPSAQAAGTYNNSLYIKAVPYGESP